MVIKIFNILLFPICITTIICLLTEFFGFTKRKNKLPFAIISGVLAVANTVINIMLKDIDISSEITEIIVVFSAMLLPYLLLNVRKKLTFVWWGLIVCSTLDYLTSLTVSFFSNDTLFLTKTVGFVWYVLLFGAIVALSVNKKINIPVDFLDTLSPTIYVVIFFAEFSSYYKVALTKDSSFYVGVSNVLTLLSAALVVGCFSYIIFKYSSLSYKQKESERQLETELKHYEEMMNKNRDIRTFRHDYKNNLFALNTYIKDNRNEEALEYIEALTGELINTQNSFATGNYLADAIFSEKNEIAKSNGTTVSFAGTIPQNGINNSDLCIIVSNALDNAIRACKKQESSVIEVVAEERANAFIITFANPIEQRVVIKNNQIKTTKKDNVNHGLGISNIKKVAKKYNGSVQLSCTDEQFLIRIGLILNRE